MFDPSKTLLSKKSKEDVAKISNWVITFLHSSEVIPTNVMVTEIACQDPTCVPIETLVIVFGPTARWTGKVLKPMSDVTEMDIRQLFLSDEVLSVMEKPVSNLTIETSTSGRILAELAEIEDESERCKSIDALLDLLRAQKLALTMNHNESNPLVSTNSANIPAVPITVVKMMSNQPNSQTEQDLATKQAVSKRPVRETLLVADTNVFSTQSRHSKGTRQRGCPCCDPDNIDNVVDRLLFLDSSP